MNHTPGPWTASPGPGDGEPQWFDVEADRTLEDQAEGQAFTYTYRAGIAMVYSRDGAGAANARLIAAAPALLGLVLSARALLAWYREDHPPPVNGLTALLEAIDDVVRQVDGG